MLKQLKNLLQAEIDPAFAERAKFIFKQIEQGKPKRILDVGCGRGFYLNALSLYKFPMEIHGIDINEKYLEKAQKSCLDKRIQIKKVSIYNLPYRDCYFDFIVCSEVLEHLKDDKGGLKELGRVLKKNGTIAITVPNYNFPFFWDPINFILMRFFKKHINKNVWWLAGIWADHERLYRQKEIEELLKGAGFKIKTIRLLIHWCWPFSHFLLYGIGKNLVERLNLSQFNRFNFRTKQNFSRLISQVFKAPPRFLDDRLNNKLSVNLFVLATLW